MSFEMFYFCTFKQSTKRSENIYFQEITHYDNFIH